MSGSYVTETKKKQIALRMKKLGIKDGDLVEKFVLGSGRGGQKLNKTSSCVYLRHTPTGLETKCQGGRTRSLNRYMARKRICDKIAKRLFGEKDERRKKEEKIKRQKRRRSRRQKEKILSDKKKQSEKKKLRKPVDKNE